MAIYQITEVKQQQQGEWNSDASRSYTRILQCLSDDPADDSATVLTAVTAYLGIPLGTPTVVLYQSGNGNDAGAWLNKIRVLQETNHRGEYKNWIARLEYGTQLMQQWDNPLTRPTVITGGFQMYQKPIERDTSGKLITNTAGQPFDDFSIDDARSHVTMVRNEATYDWTYFADNFVNFVNLTSWYGCPAGTAKCVSVGGQGPNYENGVSFYTVTYEFQYRKEGWQPKILNRGTKDINGKPVLDSNGDPSDRPEFLGNTALGFGTVDGIQVWPFPIANQSGNIITPTVYYTAEFNLLGLP